MRHILVVLALALLTGCNSMPTSQDKEIPIVLAENEGMIFGTFTREYLNFEYYSQYFYFKNIETGKKYMIESRSQNFLGGSAAVDYHLPKSKGVLFTFKLPAGKYSFYNFRLYHATGMYNADFYAEKDYSIPFEVTPKKASYIGDIKLIPLMAKNVFGLPIPKGGYWEIRNEKIRDISKFINKYPGYDWPGNLSIVPTTSEIESPLVMINP